MSSLAGAVTHPFTADAAGAGAIYGTITAMAVVAGTDERAMSQVFVLVLGTLLVLWLAHAYAHTLARHIEHGGRATWRALRATLVEERSFLVGPSPMLVVLALGALDVLPDSADTISLWVGLVQLVSWGTAYSRRLGRSWMRALGTGLINGLLGLAVVLLEASLH